MTEYTDGDLLADSLSKVGSENVFGIYSHGSLGLLDELSDLDRGAHVIREAVEKNMGEPKTSRHFSYSVFVHGVETDRW